MADVNENNSAAMAHSQKSKYQEYLDKLETWKVAKQASRSNLSATVKVLGRSASMKTETNRGAQDGKSQSVAAPRKTVTRTASVGSRPGKPPIAASQSVRTSSTMSVSSRNTLSSSVSSRSRLSAVDSLSNRIKEKLANKGNSNDKETGARGPMRARANVSVVKPTADLKPAERHNPRKINRNDARRLTTALTSLVTVSKSIDEDQENQAPPAKKARVSDVAPKEDVMPESRSSEATPSIATTSVSNDAMSTECDEDQVITQSLAADQGVGALTLADLQIEDDATSDAVTSSKPDTSSKPLDDDDEGKAGSQVQGQADESALDEKTRLRKRLEDWKKRKEEERMRTYSLKRTASIPAKCPSNRNPQISRRQTMVITSKTPLHKPTISSCVPHTALRPSSNSVVNSRKSLSSSVNKSASVARSQSMNSMNRRQTFGVSSVRSQSSASVMRKSPRQNLARSNSVTGASQKFSSSTNKRLSMATLARRSPRHQANTVKPTVASQLRRESVCKSAAQTSALKRKSISTPSTKRPLWDSRVSNKKPVTQHARLSQQTSLPSFGKSSTKPNLKNESIHSRSVHVPKPKTPQPRPSLKKSVCSVAPSGSRSVKKTAANKTVNPRRSILKLSESQGGGCGFSKSAADHHVKFSSPAPRQSPRLKQLAKTPSIKTPKKPRTEASLRGQLDEWLQAKGKTPSRYSHLRCFGSHVSNKKRRDSNEVPQAKAEMSILELNQQQSCLADESLEKPAVAMASSTTKESVKVVTTPQPEQPPIAETVPEVMSDQLNDVLDECFLLFEAGCPAVNIREWLNEIQKTIPAATQSARYWICRARIAEEEENDNHAVDIYEEAVVHGAEPANEVADALREFVIRMEDRKRARKMAAHTPGPHTMLASVSPTSKPARKKRIDVDESNMFDSSTVKYVVSDSTPFKKRQPSGSKLTPQPVVTPVRRSTRRSNATLPSMLRDHDTIMEDLDELEPTDSIFRPNMALDFDDDDDEDEDISDAADAADDDDDEIKTSLNFDDSF